MIFLLDVQKVLTVVHFVESVLAVTL